MTNEIDELDAQLARMRLDPLPDTGFAETVMTRLPARRRRRAWLRPAPLIGAVCGSALLVAQMAGALLRSVPESGGMMLPFLAAGMVGLTLLASGWAFAERDL